MVRVLSHSKYWKSCRGTATSFHQNGGWFLLDDDKPHYHQPTKKGGKGLPRFWPSIQQRAPITLPQDPSPFALTPGRSRRESLALGIRGFFHAGCVEIWKWEKGHIAFRIHGTGIVPYIWMISMVNVAMDRLGWEKQKIGERGGPCAVKAWFDEIWFTMLNHSS